ncbi:MAG: tryptophan--tRNA ligase [Brevinemataceae bacterium]
MKKRALSGIKPTGKLHLGNYFGAFQNFLELQNNDSIDNFYFIADYHSLNTIPDPQELQYYTFEIFKAFIALGLDPEKSTIFIQSSIPEHTELCWLLSGVTPVGLMERAHAYKDSLAKNSAPNMGLFNYPLLQAADILIYDSDLVPVGSDQKQHIEITRDIAEKFNRAYGEGIFTIPEPLIQEETAIIPGTDGEKMSKSKNNIISIFDSEKEIKKQVMGIITDSTPLEDPKDFRSCPVYNIYKLMASPNEIQQMQFNYSKGGYGYGHAKTALFEKIISFFAQARNNMNELNNNPVYVQELIKSCSNKARIQAQKKIQQVRKSMGLGVSDD